MIDIFAVALKCRMNFLFAEVKSICPVDVSIFHQYNVRVIAIVLGLEETVVEARVSHKSDVVEIKRMSDCMLV